MPKYVVHIGPARLGSAYLQASLRGLRAQLEQQGILYPAAISAPMPAHHMRLDHMLRAGPPDAALELAFTRMNAAGHRVIVLSCERACTLPDPAIHHLRRLVGVGNPVELVYYWQPLSERIPALWTLDVRHGYPIRLPEAVIRAARAPMQVPDHNASLLWERWANVFGRASLSIVSVNNLRDHQVDLFDHFAATFLGCTGAPRPAFPAGEEPLNAIDTEILRVLNAMEVARGGNVSGDVFPAFQKVRPQVDMSLVLQAMDSETTTITIDDRAGAFLPVYTALMAFHDRLASPEYGTELFSGEPAPFSYVRQDCLLRPGVTPALRAMFSKVREFMVAAQRAAAVAPRGPGSGGALLPDGADRAKPTGAGTASAAWPAGPAKATAALT
jgi:hypothetical protein